MATFGKELMDSFYAKERAALAKQDFELSFVWSGAESLVNSLHHGKHPSEWIPKLVLGFNSNAENAESAETHGSRQQLTLKKCGKRQTNFAKVPQCRCPLHPRSNRAD